MTPNVPTIKCHRFFFNHRIFRGPKAIDFIREPMFYEEKIRFRTETDMGTFTKHE